MEKRRNEGNIANNIFFVCLKEQTLNYGFFLWLCPQDVEIPKPGIKHTPQQGLDPQ